MIQIRLQKRSAGSTLTYYIIVKQASNHINGSFLEKLGFYFPHRDTWQNKYVFIHWDKFLYWLARGGTLNTNLFLLLKSFFYTMDVPFQHR